MIWAATFDAVFWYISSWASVRPRGGRTAGEQTVSAGQGREACRRLHVGTEYERQRVEVLLLAQETQARRRAPGFRPAVPTRQGQSDFRAMTAIAAALRRPPPSPLKLHQNLNPEIGFCTLGPTLAGSMSCR